MTLGRPIHRVRPAQGSSRGEPLREFEAVLSDLEWRRVRRRVAMHPALAVLRNCGTLALILALKLASPALAR